MKKKVTVLTACILAAAGVIVGASAMGVIQKVESELRSDFVVKIDGQTQTFRNVNGETVYPMLYNGTTYLPVRSIGEIMGKTVYWYEDTKTIELKSEGTAVTDADVIVTASPAGNVNQNPASDIHSVPHNPDNHRGGAELNQNQNSAAGSNSSQEITLEQAKEIALQKAGFTAAEVYFTEAKKELDDGRYVYDIEFKKDGMEYSAEILVSDGTVVSWDVERD